MAARSSGGGGGGRSRSGPGRARPHAGWATSFSSSLSTAQWTVLMLVLAAAAAYFFLGYHAQLVYGSEVEVSGESEAAPKAARFQVIPLSSVIGSLPVSKHSTVAPSVSVFDVMRHARSQSDVLCQCLPEVPSPVAFALNLTHARTKLHKGKDKDKSQPKPLVANTPGELIRTAVREFNAASFRARGLVDPEAAAAAAGKDESLVALELETTVDTDMELEDGDDELSSHREPRSVDDLMAEFRTLFAEDIALSQADGFVLDL